MPPTTDPRIETIADACIVAMGPIFVHSDSVRADNHQGADSRSFARQCVANSLQELVEKFDTCDVYPAILRAEYSSVVTSLTESTDDVGLVAVLVGQSDWTERGARELAHLARRYGSSFLRNALALAEALEIEDGEAGL